ncbi:myeloid-associated differentiation marker homolog [Nothobranchius furzeri]|uniref:Myeloid-associated differentiation marker homolog n=1 Tax=Nothobranchius furzeri TaxID=105023 RepID=A0A8C6LI63_NOTFU|nr:myeloid-associated differentiation marker-like protein [Nothobranchius furzeri]
MVTLDFTAVTKPVGIVRVLEVIFLCITFSLMASVGYSTDVFWTWCLFTWCFCFCVSFLIILLEVTSLNTKLPISWDDLTTSFSMLATLMVFTASIIFSYFFTCPSCSRMIGVCVTSFLAYILYAIEVGMTRAKPGEIRGFLATVPGHLKVLEAFVACIIFICLGYQHYSWSPGLQWCVAVYSLCFIFSFLFIVLTICRLLSLFPAPLDKVLSVCNVVAVLMYITAAVIWPVYSFKSIPNYKGFLWDLKVVVSFMTCFNLAVYIADTVYSFRVHFISREAQT